MDEKYPTGSKSRARNRLSAVAVRNLSKPGFHHDGGGLYLQVSRTGSKSWVLRYTLDKKVRDMGLGPFGDWTLAEARDRAKTYRQLVDDGIDPIVHRDQDRLKRRAAEATQARQRRTFAECAKEFHTDNHMEWKNLKHRDQWINTLTTYAFPEFGSVPMSELTQDHVGDAVKPIWRTKPETASRVFQRIRTVVNYGAAKGYCNGFDTEVWEGIKLVLQGVKKAHKAEHHAACPYDQVGSVMRTVRNGTSSDAVKLAFQFIVLTACRSGEARLADWKEIDEKNRLWAIPKERMKAGRKHTVPLSAEALSVLELAKWLQPENKVPTGLIFVNPARAALSDMTLTQLLRRMKVMHTMHGFRASFRTWGADLAHYERDILELALAHSVGDKLEQAYQRSDMRVKRHTLMQDWADYIKATESAELITENIQSRPRATKAQRTKTRGPGPQ